MTPEPIMTIQDDSERTVICLQCKEPIGESQEELGKAYCEDCEKAIFSTGYQGKFITSDEFDEQQRLSEQKAFLKTMDRLFRRMRS